jgi:hypothetical protein
MQLDYPIVRVYAADGLWGHAKQPQSGSLAQQPISTDPYGRNCPLWLALRGFADKGYHANHGFLYSNLGVW